MYPRNNHAKEQNKIKLKLNKIENKFNGIQVTNFHNRSTEPLILELSWPQSIKQSREHDD